MTNYPTLEPVVVTNGSFVVERLLDRPGRVEVGVGDNVIPDDVVARTGSIEKSFTLYLANELDMPNDSLRKHLTKTVGSTVNEGEVLARVRRGLRTAAVRSPATGTLINVDDATGTVTLTASTGPRDLKALVPGVVERVHSDSGVTIRASGSRVYGIVGFGGEASGRLSVGIDRHDRELTSDQVSKDWRGTIVLAGMTVGVPALTQLRDAGVSGVIVGSVAEADVRRFLSPSGSVESLAGFWTTTGQESLLHKQNAPFVIIVTEGFGRHPMAEAVFDFLASKEGSQVSMHGNTAVGRHLARPEIYIAGDAGADGNSHVQLEAGRTVRITDSQDLATVGVTQSEPVVRALTHGIQREYVTVELSGGEIRHVPVSNVEVLL